MRTITIALLAALAGTAPAWAQERLKPGPGAEETSTSCSICHTTQYIRMNSVFLTADGWKAEVAKMRDAYGAPIDDDTANAIVKYLSTAYGAPKPS